MSDDDDVFISPSHLQTFVGSAEPERGAVVPVLYTRDLPDVFFAKLGGVCDEVSCACDDMLSVMKSESDIRATALNDNPKDKPPDERYNAAGLVQHMPATLRNCGFRPELGPRARAEAYCAISAADQLPYVRRYFAPYRGKLVNATALYLATFLPALLEHAQEDDYELVIRGGRLGWAYAPNLGFDANHDGIITVGELGQRLAVVRALPRYVEAAARAAAIAA